MGLFSSLFGGSSNKTTTSTTKYGSTKTSNPFVISKTNNKGTKSSFVKGSAFDKVNQFVNSNIDSVLNDYFSPSLDSVTNQALLNNYMKNLQSNAASTLENNIISPLADRNMIRSSQATNMYKNLSNNMTSNISSYINELLANSQQNSANMLNNMLSSYLKGFSAISANQAQSLKTSSGNATRTNSSSSNNSSDMTNSAMQLLPYLLMMV